MAYDRATAQNFSNSPKKPMGKSSVICQWRGCPLWGFLPEATNMCCGTYLGLRAKTPIYLSPRKVSRFRRQISANKTFVFVGGAILSLCYTSCIRPQALVCTPLSLLSGNVSRVDCCRVVIAECAPIIRECAPETLSIIGDCAFTTFTVVAPVYGCYCAVTCMGPI